MKNYSLFSAYLLAVGIISCAGPRDAEEGAARGDGARALTIFTWGDYLSPVLTERFTEDTGIAVEVVTFENSDEMLAKMLSEPERFDVITTDDYTLKQLKELSLLRSIDRSKLKNFGNVDGRYLGMACDPGNRYSIPYLAGTTVVAYRKDLVGEPEKSWGILFDPRWGGRVAMLDESEDMLVVARLASGHPANSRVPGHITDARDKILGQIRDVGVKFGSFVDILEALDSGEIWIGMSYSGDALRAAAENPNIGFFLPEEGAIKWLDSLVLSRDSQRVEEAHRFLDFMLEGENAAESANYLYLASPNVEAAPKLNPLIRSDPRIYLSDEDLARASYLSPYKDPRAASLGSQVLREIWAARRAAGSSDLIVHTDEAGIGAKD